MFAQWPQAHLAGTQGRFQRLPDVGQVLHHAPASLGQQGELFLVPVLEGEQQQPLHLQDDLPVGTEVGGGGAEFAKAPLQGLLALPGFLPLVLPLVAQRAGLPRQRGPTR